MRQCPNCDEKLSLRQLTRLALVQPVVCSLCRRELIANRRVLFTLGAVLLALSPFLYRAIPENFVQLLIAVPIVFGAVWGFSLICPIDVVEDET